MNNVVAPKFPVRTYLFARSSDAWAFVRGVDAMGAMPGFPGVEGGGHTVQVLVRTTAEIAGVDDLADAHGGEVRRLGTAHAPHDCGCARCSGAR